MHIFAGGVLTFDSNNEDGTPHTFKAQVGFIQAIDPNLRRTGGDGTVNVTSDILANSLGFYQIDISQSLNYL